MNAVTALKNYALRTGLIDETEERRAASSRRTPSSTGISSTPS